MTMARLIRRKEVEELRGVDVLRAQLEREFTERREALEAEREKILQDARERALRDSMQAAAKIVVDAEAAAERRISSLEPEIARLVAETVAQVIGDMDQDEAVRRATINALLQLKTHRRARIMTAPDVAQSVRSAVTQVAGQGAEVIDFEVDERLEPGRTVLSSELGHVEIGLSDQVAAVCEVWAGEPEEEPVA